MRIWNDSVSCAYSLYNFVNCVRVYLPMSKRNRRQLSTNSRWYLVLAKCIHNLQLLPKTTIILLILFLSSLLFSLLSVSWWAFLLYRKTQTEVQRWRCIQTCYEKKRAQNMTERKRKSFILFSEYRPFYHGPKIDVSFYHIKTERWEKVPFILLRVCVHEKKALWLNMRNTHFISVLYTSHDVIPSNCT